MTVINTNVSALRAQNNSRVAERAQSQAMERLSSGKRINSAKDDAAGLAIATRMDASVRGLNQAIRNSTPQQIEALDMGRRGLHNEASELLRTRLQGKIDTNLDTSRPLFTLICALHWRG